MRFIVDAQLPRDLVTFLKTHGHEAMHTAELPEKNRTPDEKIRCIADADGRIVVSKDDDFVTSHLLRGKPEVSDASTEWKMRATDIDALNHMNNAVYWEALEELVRANGGMKSPVEIVLEHHDAIERGDEVSIRWRIEGDRLYLWHVVNDGRIAAASCVRSL